MDDLRAKRCRPCDRGTPKLDETAIAAFAAQLPRWTVEDERLRRRITFAGFRDAIRFVDRMAELAEAEDHHPDFCVHYRQVDVTLWTHAVGGLSENDFILAAKLDELLENESAGSEGS
jgi:4a-hydroxytetrahydrobiopterin dehydratase